MQAIDIATHVIKTIDDVLETPLKVKDLIDSFS
jgi:hypothetical protein